MGEGEFGMKNKLFSMDQGEECKVAGWSLLVKGNKRVFEGLKLENASYTLNGR